MLLLFFFVLAEGWAWGQQRDTSLESSASPGTSVSAANSFENSGSGIQQINGFGTLSAPNCTTRMCAFAFGRVVPGGTSEALFGVLVNFGIASEEERALAEKIRAEAEAKRYSNEFRLQLLDRLSASIKAGNQTEVRAFAIALAPLEGYPDFRDYLRAIFSTN
jgi:hypothetical protein